MAMWDYGAGGLKNAYASSERRLLKMIGPEDAKLFEQKSQADAIVMAIGRNGSATIEALRDFSEKLGDANQNFATAWDEAKDWFRDTVEQVKRGIQ